MWLNLTASPLFCKTYLKTRDNRQQHLIGSLRVIEGIIAPSITNHWCYESMKRAQQNPNGGGSAVFG